MRGAFLVVAVFAASTALSGAWAFSAAGPSLPASTQAASGDAQGWAVQVRSCSQNWSAPDAVFDVDCLEQLWKSAFQSKALAVFNEVMWAQQQAAPLLGAQCHEAGHRTGQFAFAQSPDVSALISAGAAQRFACNNGFIHGVLDGMATSDPDEGTLRSAFTACQLLSGDARANCVDGTGHASWQATHDVDQSLGLCSAYPDEADRSSCFAGVIMQMFRPDTDGGRPAAVQVATAPHYMKDLCGRLRSQPPPYADACFATAAMFFSLDADQETRRFAGAYGSQGKSDAPQSVEQVAAMWQDAAVTCQVFAPYEKGVQLCRDRLARSVIWASRTRELTDAICSSLDADLRSPCREARAE